MVWCILDCELIRTSSKHVCIRAMYVLLEDETTDKFLEFLPCVDIKLIETKYQQSYIYCRKWIHKLPYYPVKMSGPCLTAPIELERFIKQNKVNVVFYKGGQAEKILCDQIGVLSHNIEDFGVPKVKSHNPREEVISHLTYLKSNCLETIDSYMNDVKYHKKYLIFGNPTMS